MIKMVIFMKKYILTVFISLLVGFLLSNYMLKEYDSSILTFNEKKTLYLVQQGVYSSMESMKENTSNLNEYIYSNIDNLYYVYIGITLDSENTIKIQNVYKDIDTIVKTSIITDKELIEYIEKFDVVLKETNDSETVKEIAKQVLKKYKGE
jgi:hypothetical protein